MKLMIAVFAHVITAACLMAGALDQPAYGRTVRADILAKAYDTNPLAADQTYKGQVYSIGGVIKSIESDETVYVELAVPSSLNEIYYIKCVFSNTRGLDRLKAGSSVSIRGTIEGKRGSKVLVSNCILP